MNEIGLASAAEFTCTLPENAKIVDVNGERLYTREYVDAERKAAIERCAALCADLEKKYWTSYRSIDGVDLDYDFVLGKADSVKECEAAIRALLEE